MVTDDYLNGLSSGQDIYRYISLDEFESLRNGVLRLTCPFKWAEARFGDPYENILYQTEVFTHLGNQLPTIQQGEKIYAYCWTLNRESDAMWRLYCPKKYGIKIKTTAGKLLDLVKERFNIEINNAVFTKIGRVKYQSLRSFERNFHTVDGFKLAVKDLHGATLLKRRPYKHENEVRLVAYDHDGVNHISDPSCINVCGNIFKRYHLDFRITKTAHTWIDEVVIDPRMSSKRAEKLEAQFQSYGFKEAKRSSLYGSKKITIHLRSPA